MSPTFPAKKYGGFAERAINGKRLLAEGQVSTYLIAKVPAVHIAQEKIQKRIKVSVQYVSGLKFKMQRLIFVIKGTGIVFSVI